MVSEPISGNFHFMAMEEYNASFERLMVTFERFCEMKELKLPASISQENTALGNVSSIVPQVFDESPLPDSTAPTENPQPPFEPPMFTGDSDPSSWLEACVRYFSDAKVPANEMVDEAGWFLENAAYFWFLDWENGRFAIAWDEFSQAISCRFGPSNMNTTETLAMESTIPSSEMEQLSVGKMISELLSINFSCLLTNSDLMQARSTPPMLIADFRPGDIHFPHKPCNNQVSMLVLNSGECMISLWGRGVKKWKFLGDYNSEYNYTSCCISGYLQEQETSCLNEHLKLINHPQHVCNKRAVSYMIVEEFVLSYWFTFRVLWVEEFSAFKPNSCHCNCWFYIISFGKEGFYNSKEPYKELEDVMAIIEFVFKGSCHGLLPFLHISSIDYMMSWSVSLQLGYSHHFFDGSLESSTVLQFVFSSTFTGIITLPKAASSTFEALLFLCTQLIRGGGELVFNRGGCVTALLGRDVKKWKRDGSYGFNSYHVGLQGRGNCFCYKELYKERSCDHYLFVYFSKPSVLLVELYTARWIMEGMLPFFMHTNDVQVSSLICIGSEYTAFLFCCSNGVHLVKDIPIVAGQFSLQSCELIDYNIEDILNLHFKEPPHMSTFRKHAALLSFFITSVDYSVTNTRRQVVLTKWQVYWLLTALQQGENTTWNSHIIVLLKKIKETLQLCISGFHDFQQLSWELYLMYGGFWGSDHKGIICHLRNVMNGGVQEMLNVYKVAVNWLCDSKSLEYLTIFSMLEPMSAIQVNVATVLMELADFFCWISG